MSRFDIHLKYPEQHLLCAKPVFVLHNLLHNRRQEDSGNFFCWTWPMLNCRFHIASFLFQTAHTYLYQYMHMLDCYLRINNAHCFCEIVIGNLLIFFLPCFIFPKRKQMEQRLLVICKTIKKIPKGERFISLLCSLGYCNVIWSLF